MVTRKNNYIFKVLTVILALMLAFSSIAWRGIYLSRRQIPKNTFIYSATPTICFSIDDATDIFEEIAVNKYDSIFQCQRLAVLRAMHINYGADTILFIFENTSTFSIKNFPSKYKKEFQQNADWLKLGWHFLDENDPDEVHYTSGVLEDSYYRTCLQINRFAGNKSLSSELRLHYWYATDNLVNYLIKNGVIGLYYVDRVGAGYGFNSSEDAAIRDIPNGLYYKKYVNGNVLYSKTDIRLEMYDTSNDLLNAMEARKQIGDNRMVIFTHSNLFIENYEKICTMCEWAKQNGYTMNYFN